MAKIILESDSDKLPKNRNFNLRIYKCGQENCDSHKLPEEGPRPFNSLHFITYGKGHLCVGNEELELKAGNAFLLYSGEEYRYYPDVSNPWSYVWVDFFGSGIAELFGACGFKKKKPWLKVSGFKKMRNAFERVLETYYEGDAHSISCMGSFLTVIGLFFDNEEKKTLLAGSSPKSIYIREALAYINNNYRLNLTVEGIARNVHISSSYLMSLFVQEIGMTIVEYINRFRVAYACQFLKNPNIKVGEVAKMVGYSDPLYFSRVFSKIKGMSPRQYVTSDCNEDPFTFLRERNIDL